METISGLVRRIRRKLFEAPPDAKGAQTAALSDHPRADIRAVVGDDRGPLTKKRSYDRVAVSIPITLQVESPQERGRKIAHKAYMLDCSVRGARLTVAVALRPGEIVELIPSEGPKFVVQGRVAWVGRAGTQHETEMGIEYLQPLAIDAWARDAQKKL